MPKLSSERTHFRLRSRENFAPLRCRTSTFQKSFFPSAITGWNSLDLDVRKSVSPPTLKRKLGQFAFRLLTIGYMIVLLKGVYLLITPALDLGFLVLENISSKLIVACRLFASAFLTLNR